MSVRLVACGASNLSRGLPRLLGTVGRSGPVEAFVAAGHGRSYGVNSRVWMRRLPSIVGCGLWRALDRRQSSLPLVAVVTDVGNDLLYGFSVEQTADWVRASIERLAERGATIVVTRLPLESIFSVGPARYHVLRTCYVPGCVLSLDELKARAEALDAAVVAMAHEHAATVIAQPGAWYGLDAIHVRRHRLDELWAGAARVWGLDTDRVTSSWATWVRVGTAGAEVRSLGGFTRFTPQPVIRHRDGGFVAMY